MKPGIHFEKIWFDNDVVELRIESFDGDSFFTTKVYVGHQDFAEAHQPLKLLLHRPQKGFPFQGGLRLLFN